MGQHKKLPCKKCGQPRKDASISKLCYQCYKQKRKDDAKISIQIKQLHKIKGAEWKKERNKPFQKDNTNKLTQKVKVEICKQSPIKRHHFIIDSDHIGICKWCKLVRDYNKLQPKFNNKRNFGTL